MRIRGWTAVGTIISLLTTWWSVPVQAEGSVTLIVEMHDERSHVPLSVYRVADSVQRMGYQAPRQYTADGSTHTAADLRRWYSVTVSESDALEIEEQLRASSDVVSVRREYMYQQVALPNDAQFAQQYGLHSISFPLADINAPEAWNASTGSGSTIIAVIDGGVDLDHEDLQGKIWTNDDTVGDGVDNDNNGFIDDTHGWDFVAEAPAEIAIDHATHVAGIAAASSNNSVGVAGVDWGARIMSVRVLGFGGGGGEENIIEGINYAVANGAKVINLSIAGSASPALAAAVENAYAAGVVVVAAAGNSGANTDFFSIYPVCAELSGTNLVLGVGATDEEGEPANFSNYGKCVDVSAPGKSILSTKTDNDYGEMSGTSMAAPFVSGVAGLYLASHANASPAEVMQAIIQNAVSFEGEDAADWNTEFKGRLNAAAAVGSNGSSSGSSNNGSPSGETSAPEGGGGESSGGGDGGGGGEGESSSSGTSTEVKPTPKPKPRVLGVSKVKPNLALVPKINAAFRTVFGRNPITVEHAYWFGRVKRGEKRSFIELVGAMAWQKAKGKTYIPTSSHKTIGKKTASK